MQLGIDPAQMIAHLAIVTLQETASSFPKRGRGAGHGLPECGLNLLAITLEGCLNGR
jgi:hypothetical protein